MGIARALERQRAGTLEPGRFRLEASSSPWLLQRVIRVNTLEGHEGCVNTVEFSPDGNTLLSGSDDFKIILWDWQRGEQRLAFSSSHHGNIFQAKPLPGSDNRIIFSCAADGHVLVHTQGSSGTFSSRELGSHDGRAHKLALSPDSTFLLSSGEDGYVRWYDVRAPPASSRATIVAKATTEAAAVIAADKPDLDVIDLRMPELPGQPGSRVLRRCLPPHRQVMDGPGISSAVYSRQGDILASYMSDSIFLFPGTELAGAGHEHSLQRATALYTPVESPPERRPPSPVGEDDGGSQRSGTRTPPVRSDNEAVLDDDMRAFLTEHLTELFGSQPNTDGSAMRVRFQGDSDSDDDEGSGLSIPEDIEASSSSHSMDDDEDEGRSNDLVFREPLFAWEDDVDSDEDPNTPDNEEMERSPSASDNDDDDWGEYASSGLATSSSSSDGGSSYRSSGSSASHDGYRSGGHNTENVELPNDHPMWGAGLPGTVSMTRPWYEKQPGDHILQRYRGHRNTETIKSVSFLGPEDNWIVSGSDDGYMYIWDRYTGQLLVHQRADRYIMNCSAQHPSMPYVMATSGIENDIKLWEIGRGDPVVPGMVARRCMEHNIASSTAERMSLEEMASMVEQGATLRLNMPACPTQ